MERETRRQTASIAGPVEGQRELAITHVVCTSEFAGVEQYVAYVASRQAAVGHTVRVIGGAEKAMGEALGSSGVQWRPGGTVPAAQRALLSVGGHVVHAHMTAAEIAAVSTKPVHRRPVIATLHFAQPRGGHRHRRRLYRQMERFLDAQIAISGFVADRANTTCEVIPNGVPWNLPPQDRRPVVLMAQRLEREKDTALALEAWALSGLAERGWRLDIAGDGAERLSLTARAAQLGIDPSVHFLGFVPDAKQRMTEASIFLATAPEEPFGLSVVEAMAAGTPVVAAAGGAHPETIGPAGDRHLFQPGSAERCASALTRLVDDPVERDRYGEAIRQRWANRFTIERHCAQLDDVYRRVLALRSKQQPS